MEICLACPALHDGKFSPPLSRHPWLFCFILCAASYFILSTSFPSLHRYYRHAKAGWEGHNDLCFMLLPRLLRGAEGETLLLTTPSPLPALPTRPLHRGRLQPLRPAQRRGWAVSAAPHPALALLEKWFRCPSKQLLLLSSSHAPVVEKAFD